MLRNILKLNGIQEISKEEQKSINGGYIHDMGRYSSCSYHVLRMTESQCLSDLSLYPIYLGGSKCSLLGTGPCNE
ncbi:hypothetical protein [Flavobacterium polysaccharolyticum]|uniref:Bacteriocin n=1 Tax=Flavobacterium polysaccharolyticum TaxID=3133148 RepID=A0ABU9NL92_9FLAO